VKVLQINSVCGIGSTGRIAVDLYKVLEEKGHECVIAYGRGIAPSDIKSIKIGTNIDNYMHIAKTRLADRHGFGSMKATKEFIKKVKEYNPDIIHLHNIHGYYINVEILFNYLKEANKPVVWTLHDCWAFTGHCAHFDYIGCDKWKTSCSNCLQKKVYPSSLIKDSSEWNYQKKKELFTSIRNMTIITPSEWLRNLVKQSFLGKYPVKIINNGIDLKTFKPTENDFREKHILKDKFIILGVSSVWNVLKGMGYFAEIAGKLDDSYKIILVGVTKSQKKKLPKNITGIIKTNNSKELANLYTMADVFVNPTLEDSFPTTNLESLACGTPVITFDTGGSVESVDSSCGIIVKKGSVSKLVFEIIKLKQENFGVENCIDRAKAFDKKERFKEYINIYELIE